MDDAAENRAAEDRTVDSQVDTGSRETWQPPIVNGDGQTQAGKYPLNHRKRAEALAKAGASTDPDGLIGDDVIKDASKRLAADAKAAKDAKAPARTETEKKES